MNSITRRTLAFALLFAGLACSRGALAVDVTFQVRMGYQMELGAFDPGSDSVDIAGSFNGWGSDPLTLLSDTDGDSLYEVTLGPFDESDHLEFKFRIKAQWDGFSGVPQISPLVPPPPQ